MSINQSIRFFRKNNKQSQKEIIPENISTSTMSRFEAGKGALDINELDVIVDKLSITAEELLTDSDLHTKQSDYESLFNYCSTHLENKSKKTQLLKYYQCLTHNNNITLREFSNLISIKCFFSNYWEEIPPISKREVTKIYRYLMKRDYLTHYDYSLLLKISILLDYERANTIMKKAIPIKNLEKRTEKTKLYAFNSLRNMITNRLYNGDYHNTSKFIAYSEKQFGNTDDYRFKIHVTFLKFLTKYLETNDLDYYTKLINIIKITQEIGEELEANSLKHDIEVIIEKKKPLKLFETNLIALQK